MAKKPDQELPALLDRGGSKRWAKPGPPKRPV
jgi:hypothetical protein